MRILRIISSPKVKKISKVQTNQVTLNIPRTTRTAEIISLYAHLVRFLSWLFLYTIMAFLGYLRHGIAPSSCRSFCTSRLTCNIKSHYKQAMTKLSASATVITTTSRTGTEPRGLTVSSLTSLSLNPTPLVSFNLQLPSRTSEILHERNVFAVNVVPGTPQIRDLTIAFAGGYGHDVNPFEKFSNMFTVPANLTPHKQESHDHNLEGDLEEFKHAHNIPVIKDALAVLYCRKRQIFKVQDHEIWVAEVFHVDATNCNDNSATTLLYQNRSFHSLGPVLDWVR